MQRDYVGLYDQVSWDYDPDPADNIKGESKKFILPFREGEPQVILSSPDPLGRVRPHYHPTHQFVVVLEGSGSMGREPLKPGIFEYTDKNTAYGPVSIGPEGLSFINCRQVGNQELYPMPESRHIIPRPQGRQKIADANDVPYQVIKLPGSGESVGYKLLIGSEEEGPWAEIFKVGPGQTLQIPARTEELGQYHLVLEGELMVGGEVLGQWSVRYVQGMGASSSAEVGSSGVTVAVLSFDKDG